MSYHLKLCCWVVRQDAGILRASLTPVLIQHIPKLQLSEPGEEQEPKLEIKMSLAVPPIIHITGFPMDRYQCFVLLHYIWRRDRKRGRILLPDKEVQGVGTKRGNTSQNLSCEWSTGSSFILSTGHDPLTVDKACRRVTIPLSYKRKYCFREYLQFEREPQVCVQSIRNVDWFC